MLPAESRFFKGFCPDKKCQHLLYIMQSEKFLECHQCGQKHNKNSFQDLREVQSDELNKAVQNYIYRIYINSSTPKRGAEMVKVLGLSNYYCKLLSPLLTRYGMDKTTGRAKLLTEMNQAEILDCSIFGDRAFLIEPDHISIHGYGKDITGSLNYLSETLKLIVNYNEGEERLVPIHTDGDGHCLVHAVSRALVGRELFWHPLRCCLKRHFETNLDQYKELFKDFIDTDEWRSIIDECDPDFQPPEGELHGLRNIHIFGLANVLRRPIILLDSLECMQKCGDYSALFLPGFVNPEMCKGKDNTLNKPICIAWSSYSHNHYIPLVGIQKKPLPSIPPELIPKVWGMPQSQISSYMEFDDNGGCVIGGNRTLSDGYIQRLVNAMEILYYEKNGINPLLVADAKLYLYPDNVLFCAKPAMVLERTKAAVQEGRLYRCLVCGSLCELNRADDKWSTNNSAVCSQILQSLKKIQDSSFSHQDYITGYDTTKNDFLNTRPEVQGCSFCPSRTIRKVTNDGTVIYRAEDKDNLDRSIYMYGQTKKYFPEEGISQKPDKKAKPHSISLKLVWNGIKIEEEIPYFELLSVSKMNLNQFVTDLTKRVIEKHFPDNSTDFGLESYIADEIWKLVKKHSQRNVSDLPSQPEFKRQDSAKSMKLETPLTYHSKPSEFQYIKVCTSAGQQANLALPEEGISYGQLQEWIKNEFSIPVKNQVIKKGVPPRPIKPLGDTNKQILTDLRHGDRLIVENQRRDDIPYSHNGNTPPRNVLKDSNIPKTTIAGPNNTSWDSIKVSPKAFRKGGLIYKLIARNHKLSSLLHTSLDEYPGKVFCYNPATDTIELCLKPLGHFLISKDIEERIEEVQRGLKVIGFCECPLSSRLNEENAEITVQTNMSENTGNVLLRKGPGFSVLRKPDNMDLS